MPLPRLDAHPETDIRAWLNPGEERWFEALRCPDLHSSWSTEVLLAEHMDEHGRRKKGRKYAWHGDRTPEQRERETLASSLIDHKNSAYAHGGQMLRAIATLRRTLHYTRPGVPVPGLRDESEPTPAALPV